MLSLATDDWEGPHPLDGRAGAIVKDYSDLVDDFKIVSTFESRRRCHVVAARVSEIGRSGSSLRTVRSDSRKRG